jgi:Ni/Co efflux regulator RcnB
MKRILTSLLLIASILAPVTYAAAQASNWKEIQIAPLRSFHPRQPKRI